jgi:thiol-disulfide isomerase/thioredoxin
MTVADLPTLPLVCLKTADFKDTQEIVKGKNTVIGKFQNVNLEFVSLRPLDVFSHRLLFILCSLDFWTTKCTRCPDALDKLDIMAKDPKYENVQFVSICCDKLDGARDIIEEHDDPKWQNVDHYFMTEEDKEEAKKILGFRSVPFYVVLDESGSIQQLGGSKKIDFDEIPGVVRSEPPFQERFQEEKKEDDGMMDGIGLDFNLDFSNQEPAVERVFCIDEDF